MPRKLICVLLFAVACNGESNNSRRISSIVIATTSDPDAVFPPFATNIEAQQATELMYEYLADVGPSMNTVGDSGFVKELASGWSWSADSMSISFDLNPRARWHDGRQVSSRDVVFSYALYSDSTLGSSTSTSITDVDSVTAPSASTVVFWFNKRTPHQFYDAAAQMLILPAHLIESIPRDSLRTRASSLTPVGSGRYRFGSWTKGSNLQVIAVNDHHRGRPNADRIVWTVAPEYKAAVMKVLGGEADVFSSVRMESIPDLTAGGKFRIVSLPGMDYAFMQLNLRRPPFDSRDLRRALTMSLDRVSMIRNLFDTLAMPGIGPAVRAYPVTDTNVVQIPYDTVEARILLDSLGWKRNGSGVRMKNGKPLRFVAIVPVSSPSRMRISVLIQEQLRQMGIDMKIEQMDNAALSERQMKKDFDAAFASWHLPSSPDAIRGAWTTLGEMNYGAYSNRTFDAAIDSALAARSISASRVFFAKANQIIVDDAPAVWLYEPRSLIAVSRRLNPTVMRPSAWWLDIGSWKVEEK